MRISKCRLKLPKHVVFSARLFTETSSSKLISSRPSWDDSSSGVSNLLDPPCSWLDRRCFLLLHLPSVRPRMLVWGTPSWATPVCGCPQHQLAGWELPGSLAMSGQPPSSGCHLLSGSSNPRARSIMGGLHMRQCVKRHCGVLFTCRWSNQSRASDCGKPQATLSTASRKSVSRFL